MSNNRRGGHYDFAVIGAGVGGIAIAALLADAGKKVVLFERHYLPGGYGQTFRAGKFSFCAELHYVWDCGPDGRVTRMLEKLGLDQQVRFRQLDPAGYDRIIAPGIDYLVGSGFDREWKKLSALFPAHSAALRRYFDTLSRIHQQAYRLPIGYSWRTVAAHPLRYPHLVRYLGWTLQDFFDLLGFPEPLQLILAGQSLIFCLPPQRLSLLAHAAGVSSYNSGAYVPKQSFAQFFEALLAVVKQAPGSALQLSTEVTQIHVEGGLARAVTTNRGDTVEADQVIFDGDPQLILELVGNQAFPESFRKKLTYAYGVSALSVYLGLEGIDLRARGFGDYLAYVHPSTNLNKTYEQQLADGIPDEPLFCCDSPTLHMNDPRLAPPGGQQFVIVAPCSYDYFRRLRDRSKQEYQATKEEYADRLIRLAERLAPGLSQHIVMRVIGSPLTNEYYVHAPRGNCYGMPLDPEHINLQRLSYKSPVPNLHFVGASSGMPGFASINHFTCLLYEQLTGDRFYSG